MITVLLAAYNGEEYITEQISSLLSQTVPFDTLYIRDDMSADNTWPVLEGLQRKYPDKIKISQNTFNTGNPKYNFYSMMGSVRDDYLMLCDQDDVWIPDKIEATLAKMRELEKIHGSETPLLVHTDLRVVDEKLNTVSPSFKAAMNANYDRVLLKDQIIQNTLTGCTAMYNRSLAGLIGEAPPDFMVMHDWWIMLIAAAFGHIGHIDNQTILYRQHASNKIGASDVRTLRYKINKLLRYEDIKSALDDTYKQAESFLCYYRDALNEKQIALLEEYCSIPSMNKWNRWRTICRLGVLKNGFARKVANFIFI